MHITIITRFKGRSFFTYSTTGVITGESMVPTSCREAKSRRVVCVIVGGVDMTKARHCVGLTKR